ncbi:hypothetical protein ACFW6E_07925 [Streptomyces olivaceoviridis]|uniref:hypothetical protein n=1 Tax=Streptomyces olivaceoviridis TaxID=1921 RepID=UPI00367E8A23
MADRGASALSLPEDWPAHSDPVLALHRMGSFDWDLDAGPFHRDAPALAVFDLLPEETVALRALVPVERLSDGWGVPARGGGKAVWCAFRVPRPPLRA